MSCLPGFRPFCAATTLFGVDRVPLIEEATRLELAGGVTAKIGPGVSLYAQAGSVISSVSMAARRVAAET